MKRIKYPLYLQTLVLLFGYLATLIIAVIFCFSARADMGWEAFLRSPAGDRVDVVTQAIAARLRNTDMQNWTDVLKHFGTEYGARMSLFDGKGKQVAGETVILPPNIKLELPHHHHPRMPPPEFGGESGGPSGRPAGPPPEFANQDRHGPFDPMPKMKLVWIYNGILWIGVPIFITQRPAEFHPPMMLMMSISNTWNSRLLFDFGFIGSVIAGVVLFSLLFWWPFAYRLTRRLSLLTVATEKIAEGDFSVRTGSDDQDELGRLGQSINTMADRLDGYVKSHKRLLADISHEMVTPLARLDVAVELVESCNEADRAELLADIREEVQSMHHLISELLQFTKIGIKGPQTELTPVSLARAVAAAAERVNPTQRFAEKIPTGLEVYAEKSLLIRAISNVLLNSHRYAGTSAEIVIEAVEDGDFTALSIWDTGPGVPADCLPNLGQPFYRPEFARSREGGGVGLGLAIVKGCIENCRGTVVFSNRAEGGFKVEMRLITASSGLRGSVVDAASGGASPFLF